MVDTTDQPITLATIDLMGMDIGERRRDPLMLSLPPMQMLKPMLMRGTLMDMALVTTMVDTMVDTDHTTPATTGHTDTDIGEGRRDPPMLNLPLTLTLTLKPMLMRGTLMDMDLVTTMVDTMVDTDHTIPATTDLMDTVIGEKRRDPLMLNLPPMPMPKPMLTLGIPIMDMDLGMAIMDTTDHTHPLFGDTEAMDTGVKCTIQQQRHELLP